jgi:fatty acid desaturase
MLSLFVLDPAVLCGLALWLNKGETKSFGTGVLASLAIPVATLVFSMFCFPATLAGGPFAVLLFYGLASFLVLWAVFDCLPLRALGGTAIFLVYKAASLLVQSWLS